MLVKLGKLVSLFPDGISLATYQRIARLIRAYGPMARVSLDDESVWALDVATYDAEVNPAEYIVASR